jgi:hypothetical protein
MREKKPAGQGRVPADPGFSNGTRTRLPEPAAAGRYPMAR